MPRRDKSLQLNEPASTTKQFWRPIPSILLVIYTYVASLALGTILVSVYPVIAGMSPEQADQWLSSTFAQFWLIALIDGAVLLILRWLLRLRKTNFAALGWKR